MKTLQCYITITLFLVNASLAQQETHRPTSSQTSLASDVNVHTAAPTGVVMRFPRPTPIPGSETYWPTTDAAFLDYDMQIVAVGGSPVPTVVRLAEEGMSVESTDDAAEKSKNGISENASEDPSSSSTNAGVTSGKRLLATFVVGSIAWLRMM